MWLLSWPGSARCLLLPSTEPCPCFLSSLQPPLLFSFHLYNLMQSPDIHSVTEFWPVLCIWLIQLSETLVEVPIIPKFREKKSVTWILKSLGTMCFVRSPQYWEDFNCFYLYYLLFPLYIIVNKHAGNAFCLCEASIVHKHCFKHCVWIYLNTCILNYTTFLVHLLYQPN